MGLSAHFSLIPHSKLSPEALQNLIELFVSRDGEDSGHVKASLQEKVQHVRSQLDRGESIIAFDHQSQTCNIIPKDQAHRDSTDIQPGLNK